MSLTGATRIAVSGLQANDTLIAITAGNIANASTPGYSRKTSTTTQLINPTGTVQGIEISSATRNVSSFLMERHRETVTDASYASVIADYTGRIDINLGTPGSESAIDTVYNDFTNAIGSLEVNPDDFTAREQVVIAAQVLTSRLNESSESIQDMREQADAAISASVTRVNELLQALQTANDDVAANYATGDTASFEDQQDLILGELASLMDIQVRDGEQGRLTVATSAGMTLVDKAAASLQFDTTGNIYATTASTDLGSLGVMTGSGYSIDLTSSGTPIGGEIGAYFDLRDSILPEAQAQLDEVAHSLARALSTETISATDTFSNFTITNQTEVAATIQTTELAASEIDAMDAGDVITITDSLTGTAQTFEFDGTGSNGFTDVASLVTALNAATPQIYASTNSNGNIEFSNTTANETFTVSFADTGTANTLTTSEQSTAEAYTQITTLSEAEITAMDDGDQITITDSLTGTTQTFTYDSTASVDGTDGASFNSVADLLTAFANAAEPFTATSDGTDITFENAVPNETYTLGFVDAGATNSLNPTQTLQALATQTTVFSADDIAALTVGDQITITDSATGTAQVFTFDNTTDVDGSDGATFDDITSLQNALVSATESINATINDDGDIEFTNTALDARYSLAYSDSTGASNEAMAIDLSGMQPGDPISFTFTHNGTEHAISLLRVDDSSLLGTNGLLDGSNTNVADDTVYGIAFDGTSAAAAAAIETALQDYATNNGLTPVADFTTTLDASGQFVFDVPSGTEITTLSADITLTELTDTGSTGMPLFVDRAAGGDIYSGALEDGGQKVGFAARIGINEAIEDDNQLLVRYQTGDDETPEGDSQRPADLFNRLQSSILTFDPDAGIGSSSSPFSGTVTGYLSQVVNFQGSQAANYASQEVAASTTAETYASRISEEAGVDIDEEVAYLTELQTAYQANARILSVVQELFDALMSI